MKQKKLKPLIVSVLMLSVFNLLLFLVNQNFVFAAYCKRGLDCFEFFYCAELAISECDRYCDDRCDRVVLDDNPKCDNQCYCWSNFELFCDGGSSRSFMCWEEDYWDCWVEY